MGVLTPLVADITAEGLSLVGEVTAEELGLTETDAILRGPVSVSLDLMKVEDMVAVTGVLEGTVVRQCVRCLKEYEDPLAFSVHAAFDREGKESKSAHANRNEASLARDGREQQEPKQTSRPKTKGMIGIIIRAITWNWPQCLREHMILASPMQPLCRKNCAGLCARCGKNLNEGPCQCPAEAPFDGVSGASEPQKMMSQPMEAIACP